MGYLRTEFAGGVEAAGYRRSLDIERAVATVLYEQGGARHRREAFVSAADDVIVVRLSTDGPGGLGLSLTMDHPAGLKGEAVSADTLKLAGQAGLKGEQLGVRFEAWVRVLREGGSAEVAGDRIRIAGASSVTLLIAAATDYNAADPAQPRRQDLGAECRARLDAVSGVPYGKLLERHVAEHRRLFDRVSLAIGLPPGPDLPMDERVRRLKEGAADPELLLYFFHYCRYVFISSSRPGSLPSNLQGVWNPLLWPPWHSHYQYNVNSQENYWFAESLNLAECHEPYLEFAERLTEAGKGTARLYGCRGSVSAGAFTDVWLTSRCHGRAVWGMWAMAGPWDALHLMEHYRFTGDAAFLRERAYPVLRETALFLLDWLTEDPQTGELVSGPSTSPREPVPRRGRQPLRSHHGLRVRPGDHLGRLHESARSRAGPGDRGRARARREGRPGQARHAGRRARRPAEGVAPRTEGGRARPPAHLPPLRPYAGQPDIGPQDPRARPGCQGLRGRPPGNDYHAQGWSLGWVASVLVRLGEGDRALDLIKHSYSQKLYPNLFVDAHDQVQVGGHDGRPRRHGRDAGAEPGRRGASAAGAAGGVGERQPQGLLRAGRLHGGPHLGGGQAALGKHPVGEGRQMRGALRGGGRHARRKAGRPPERLQSGLTRAGRVHIDRTWGFVPATQGGQVMAKLTAAKIKGLKGSVKGEVILPGDAAYDDARKIWNAMVDKRPALIVRCAATSDVVSAVKFARDNALLLAIRSGGHNIAGLALCDDGLVVDLSRMKAAKVDAAARRVTIEAGATLADLDAATQAHGLAVPLGINSTTGVAGLTLGGGFGWLSRKYGMTVDNLESCEVVTAEGKVLRASAAENADLFWALRGGGGNFGVVTRFEFRLHPVGPNLLSGLIVYPLAQAKSVLQQYRDFMAKAPDELSVWSVLRPAPPLPFLPAQVHGTPIIALALIYVGDPKRGETLTAPLHKFGTPLGEHVGVQPFTAWQKAFDPLLTPGARNYWKSHNFTTLKDGLFDAVIEYIGKSPSPLSEIFFGAIGGATTRPAPESAAYGGTGTRSS